MSVGLGLRPIVDGCKRMHVLLERLERQVSGPRIPNKLPVKPRTLQNRLLRQQGQLAAEFRAALESWFSTIDQEYLRALRHYGIEKVVTPDMFSRLFNWRYVEREGQEILRNAELAIYAKAGEKSLRLAGIEAAFNVNNPRFVRAAEESAGKLVTGILESVRQNIHDTMVLAIQEGVSVESASRMLRPGLTALPVSVNRINREAAERLAAGVSQGKVERWTAREMSRMRNYRAFMISRTEGSRAMNEGALFGYEDVRIKQVEFFANFGACEICQSHHGERYTAAEAHGIIPVHSNGRCTWIPVVESAEILMGG